MFGFACRHVYARCPWPWQPPGGGPAGGEPPRTPRGLLGGQTVVLLTVWASALVCGVALAGPPGGGTDDGGVAAPSVSAAPADGPTATAVTIEVEPLPPAEPASASADAGSDAVDLEGRGALGGVDDGQLGEVPADR